MDPSPSLVERIPYHTTKSVVVVAVAETVAFAVVEPAFAASVVELDAVEQIVAVVAVGQGTWNPSLASIIRPW